MSVSCYRFVFCLYTILSSPILYGLWHNQGGLGGGHVLRKTRAIAIAVVWVMPMGGGNKGVIHSCTHKNK